MEAHKSPKIDAPADKPRDEREPAKAQTSSVDRERGSDTAEQKEGGAKPASAGAKAQRGRKSKNNVRKLRTERMMSKAELARRAGVSTLTVDRVERGMQCRMDTKRKILEALGLKPSDRVMVFGDAPEPDEED
jgi:DNA-binding XRE family transcriptional regulator